MQSPYHRLVLSLLPQLLTNLDRDNNSPTYGCFDRHFWHYKIRDFASAILQQSALTLALVYQNNFQGNIYYNKKIIKEYAIAAINYWTKIQHRDGSFNEYFWMERSIPSTAFSLYAVCEACEILDYFPNNVLDTMKKATQYLQKNSETEALNQEIAATAAIAFVGKILRDHQVNNSAKKKIDAILSQETHEGWFKEYGGVDIGYLSVSLDFLVRYYELSKDPRVVQSARRIITFLQYFIHPDGSLGGEYGTRNTEYFLPYGFEYMKKYEPLCNEIINKLFSFINQSTYVNRSMDERYLLHYTSHSYVKALLIYSNKKSEQKLPYHENFTKIFHNAKLLIHSTDYYYFIISILKGGVFKVLPKKSDQTTIDCGYKLFINDQIYVSEWPNHENSYTIEDSCVEITANFKKVRYYVQNPFFLSLVKIASLIFGTTVIKKIKKNLILSDKQLTSMTLKRQFELKNDRILIEDTIDCKNEKAIVKECNQLSMRYSPSSRFYQINTMDNQTKTNSYTVEGVKTLKKEVLFSELDENN
jgi:hypothetical protein